MNTIGRYPYELPPLPYAYDALEPFIDKETMRYHHDKHFAAYIENLNKALGPYPALQALTLEELLRKSPSSLPPPAREAILNNGGGVYNHNFFFNQFIPLEPGEDKLSAGLMEPVCKTFGSLSMFRDAFTKAAMSVFGSGWACLAQMRGRELKIVTLANQETVAPKNARMLLMFDVWEHAYYLKYKNARADYVEALWSLLGF